MTKSKQTPFSVIRQAGPKVVAIGNIKIWHAAVVFDVVIQRSTIHTSITVGPFDRRIDARTWGQDVGGRLLITNFKGKIITNFLVRNVSYFSSNQNAIDNSITGIYAENTEPKEFVDEIERWLLSAVEHETQKILEFIKILTSPPDINLY